MNRVRKISYLASLALTLAIQSAFGQSTAFTYQGRLTTSGAPSAGLHDFRFRLFDAATGGAQVGSTICTDNVTVSNGLFTLQLDFGQQYATPAARFLEIDVRTDTGLNCSNSTGFVTLAPRQQLTATPLASHAKSAFALDAADGSPANAVFVDNAGNVGIGTTAPTSALHVQTSGTPGISGLSTGASGATLGMLGQANSPDGIGASGVHNASTGLAAGVQGLTNSNSNGTVNAGASGVLGIAASSSFGFFTAGVRGVNNGIGIGAAGVIGVGPTGVYGSGGTGVIGESTSTAPFASGGSFSCSNSSSGGRGVFAQGSSYGVFATTVNADATGIYGENIASTGTGNGVYGRSNSPAGRGVFGEATSASGYGGYFLGNGHFSGNLGIGTDTPAAKLDVVGTTRTTVLEIVGADLAERFPTSDKVERGMVVAIDREHPGQLCLARGAYNRCVAGIVSGANNFSAGAVLGNLAGQEDSPPIALSGRVYVRCDAAEAAIQPGDLLTTSDTPGHAMKVCDPARAENATIGKAMSSLPKGEQGLVLVLVNLH